MTAVTERTTIPFGVGMIARTLPSRWDALWFRHPLTGQSSPSCTAPAFWCRRTETVPLCGFTRSRSPLSSLPFYLHWVVWLGSRGCILITCAEKTGAEYRHLAGMVSDIGRSVLMQRHFKRLIGGFLIGLICLQILLTVLPAPIAEGQKIGPIVTNGEVYYAVTPGGTLVNWGISDFPLIGRSFFCSAPICCGPPCFGILLLSPAGDSPALWRWMRMAPFGAGGGILSYCKRRNASLNPVPFASWRTWLKSNWGISVPPR